jgi:hypothetical protein
MNTVHTANESTTTVASFPNKKYNQKEPSVMFNSNREEVRLPYRKSANEYDDLIAYETIRKNIVQPTLKYRIVMLTFVLSLFVSSIVIAILGTTLFHTAKSSQLSKVLWWLKKNIFISSNITALATSLFSTISSTVIQTTSTASSPSSPNPN